MLGKFCHEKLKLCQIKYLIGKINKNNNFYEWINFPFFFTEKDPYPIDALPTCNHALSVCQQERKCIKLFEDFKTHCKVRENRCLMDDR